jgi:hypothetical protein
MASQNGEPRIPVSMQSEIMAYGARFLRIMATVELRACVAANRKCGFSRLIISMAEELLNASDSSAKV